eukprot:4039657-Pyramimonas_sp.AAC.1
MSAAAHSQLRPSYPCGMPGGLSLGRVPAECFATVASPRRWRTHVCEREGEQCIYAANAI